MLTHESIPNSSLVFFDIGAIKINSPLEKSLDWSDSYNPVYIDLRLIISYPDLLHHLTQGLVLKTSLLKYDLVCGVPYSGIPLAAAFSLKTGTPMILKKKEIKNSGTRKNIEGVFKPGQKCLVLEDVVTNGASLLQTIKVLEESGLEVTDVVCLIDREQGAKAHLKKQGYHLYSLFTLPDLIDQLVKAEKIGNEKGEEIKTYLKKNTFQE